MLLIVLSLFLFLPVMLGWGAAFNNLLPGRTVNANIGELGMLGLFVISLIGLSLHFLVALSPTVVAGVFVGGYWLLWRHAKIVMPVLGGRPWWQWVVPLFLAVLIVAFLAYIREYHADTELYHLPSIIWARQSRVPVGLANIVDQFGFNTTWFLASALLWLPGLNLTSVFAIDALITVMFLLAIMQHGIGVVRAERVRVSMVFAFVMLVFLLSEGVSFTRIIGSPNTDIPASLITIYCFVLTLRLLEGETDDAALVRVWLSLVVFCVFSLMIKISQAPMLLLPFMLGFARGVHKKRVLMDRGVVTGMAILVLAILLWLVRGLLTSGCLVYPVASSCMGVISWVVSPESAASAHDAIRAFGLYGKMGQNLGFSDWSWLASWWDRFRVHHFARGMLYMTLFVGVLAAFARIWARRRQRSGTTESAIARQLWLEVPRGLGWMFVCALLFLAFWFLGSPDIRFGYGYLSVLMGLLLVWFMSGVQARYRKIMTYPLLAVMVFAIVLHLGNLARRINQDDWLGQWPKIDPAPLRVSPCPDLLGLWPLFKCPS